jgi:hypothetical protein
VKVYSLLFEKMTSFLDNGVACDVKNIFFYMLGL